MQAGSVTHQYMAAVNHETVTTKWDTQKVRDTINNVVSSLFGVTTKRV